MTDSGFLCIKCIKTYALSKIGYMVTIDSLNEMKNADLQSCNIDELVDIRDVKVDKSKSQMEKLVDFIEKIKNPYLFKVGDTVVKVRFSENNTQSFQQKMENIISARIAQ